MNTQQRHIDRPVIRPFICWHCAKQLPSLFTSVSKNGQLFRVHYECKPEAQRAVQ